MGIALEMLGLHYRYPEGTEALRGFSASIGENECVGLVGPNGAGKTTLLLALAGFLHPYAGELKLLGESVPFTETARLRTAIGFTFSNPDDQLFMPTVLDDVCFGPLCQGQTPELARAQAEEILTALGISELRHHFPGHLSSGQKRLAALAGVLVTKPQILAFDEPTAFLDPYSRRQVVRIIGKIPHTKLLVTHDLELVLDLCTKVIVLFDGQNVCEGTPSAVLGDDELMERYHLETPYSLRRSGCCSATRKN
jgi:cobalt/nickel transport system ATP-binding protein